SPGRRSAADAGRADEPCAGPRRASVDRRRQPRWRDGDDAPPAWLRAPTHRLHRRAGRQRRCTRTTARIPRRAGAGCAGHRALDTAGRLRRGLRAPRRAGTACRRAAPRCGVRGERHDGARLPVRAPRGRAARAGRRRACGLRRHSAFALRTPVLNDDARRDRRARGPRHPAAAGRSPGRDGSPSVTGIAGATPGGPQVELRASSCRIGGPAPTGPVLEFDSDAAASRRSPVSMTKAQPREGIKMKRKSRSPSRRLERSLLSAALAGMLLSAPAFAQSTAATIRGQVMADSAPATQAQVTATNLATGLTRSVQTGANGSYNLAGLPPGTYRIDVSAGGQASSQTVTLAIGQTATLDLGVGGVAETATEGAATDMDAVVGTAQSLVETRTSEIATYVSQRQIEALPQNSRNFLAFADTVPGMVFTTETNGNTRLRSGAQSASGINVYIDGVGQKNYTLPGGATGQDSSRGNPFPQSAIGEYKVITQNYKAEFDQISSAAIVAVTRSGSNDFQGNFFWDKTSTDWRKATEFEERAGFKEESSQEQYGVAFGGPIIVDRAHFFIAYEAKEIRTPRTLEIGRGFQPFELPPALREAYGTGSLSSPFKEDLYFGKIDWLFGEDHLFELSVKRREESDIGAVGGQTPLVSGVDNTNEET